MPDVDVVLVPVSGGGLISGIAAAMTALLPDAAVIGVEPELAGDAAESFARRAARSRGAPSRPPAPWPTGCAPSASATCRGGTSAPRCSDIITVTEDEIADATRRLALEARLVAEPSGAVATAAFLHHRDRAARRGGPWRSSPAATSTRPCCSR